MNLQDKMGIIEEHFGGPKEAAKAACVSANTWYRWKTERVKPDEARDRRSLRIIELLYEKITICSTKKKCAAPRASNQN